MNSPRFPRSPDVHNRPFEDGQNPFSDKPSTAASASAHAKSAYEASVVDDRRSQQIGDYEAVLPTRTRPLLILGWTGAVLSGLSIVLALLAISSTDWIEGMFYGAPVSFTSIAFSIPAWAMARGDLRAIRAGAMNSDGHRKTRLAYWLGFVATLVGLLPAIGAVVAVILSIE